MDGVFRGSIRKEDTLDTEISTLSGPMREVQMLSKEQTEALSELRGFLNAFEYINGKTDHGYMFEIWGVRKKTDLDLAIREVFAKWKTSSISKTLVVDWEDLISSALHRWLLAYLKGSPHLIDRGKQFNLSSDSGCRSVVQHFIEKLTSVSPIREAYTIDVKTEEFYACAHDDILLVCDEVLLFLHFEVCD
jgi:hypothetical protein